MLDKLLSNTVKVGECLEWTRCLNTDGYPRANLKGNCNIKVHRLVFELVNGYAPKVVRHICDNPKCINPDHLLAGDPTLNMLDRCERGRTHKHITEEEVLKVKALRAQGQTYKEISNQLKVNRKRVEYILTTREKVRRIRKFAEL